MEIEGYNITFVHIKDRNNVLTDTIYRLKMLNIYEEPLDSPKAQIVNNTQVVTEICATNMHTLITSMLCSEQKQDKMCGKLALQIHHGNKSSFKSVTMSKSGILQKHQYDHGLEHDIIIAPCSLVPTILHEFHDSKGHQETIHTFQAIRSYWWPKL